MMDTLKFLAGHGLMLTDWLILIFFLAQNFFSILLLILSGFGVFQFVRSSRLEITSILGLSEILPPVSVLVPAYNEEKTIVASVQSMLALNYPRFEVIVINDGSKDRTVDELKHAFQLYPVFPMYDEEISTKPVRSLYRSKTQKNLVVIDKANGGKSDALNCGVNLSPYPLICAVDADTLVEELALLRMVRPFLIDPAKVAAVGGTIRVANSCPIDRGRISDIALSGSWLVRIQVVEYIRSFLFGRLGWNLLGGPLIVSGAFGLFRKDLLIRAGGYRRETVGEDMDLVLSIHNLDHPKGGRYSVIFVPDTVCWTQVPEDLETLSRQRERWQRGQTESLVHHRRMLFSRKLGFIGLVGIPLAFFGEMMAPLMEVFGYIGIAAGYALGVVDVYFALLFFTIAWGFGVVLSAAAILLEEASFHRYAFRDVLKLLAATVLEGFGYRQINLWWRLKGLYYFARGKHDWGRMKRQSFTVS